MAEKQKAASKSLMARFMRLFFRLLYNPFAWAYDFVAASVSLGRWKQWVLAATPLLNGRRVLELGYGPGHLQAHLHDSGYQAYGLDESFQMARQASRRLKRQKRLPRLVRGLAQRLPYLAASFDSVIATFPTPYIYDPHTLDEIARVLAPDGRLVILTGAWITGKSLPDRFVAGLFRVTGQSPSPDIPFDLQLAVFAHAGFNAEVRYLDLENHRGQPTSRLIFIFAQPDLTYIQKGPQL